MPQEPETQEPVNPSAPKRKFWSYLEGKEIDFFPTGALRWWLLGLIVFAWAIEQFERLKLGPVLDAFLGDFFDDPDAGLRAWGTVAAIAAIVQGLGAYVLSNLADRYGRRPVIIWPVVIYLGIAVASAMAPNFITVAVLFIAGGFVVSGMSPAVHAAMRDITPQMGRGMAYAWISLAWTIGALMATWIAAQTIPIWPGWRPQFWIAAGFATVTVAVLIVFYRDLSFKVRRQIVHDQEEATQTSLQDAGFADEREALRSGNLIYKDVRMWLLCSTMLFWGVAYGTVAGYVPIYLKRHYGVAPADASALASYFWFIFTFSVFFSGWLSDKLQVRKPITAFGGTATGICFIYAASLPVGTSYLTLAIAWSITGFFSGFIYPAWCAIVSEHAEQISPYGVARAFGIMFLFGMVSGPIMSLALPRIVDAYGWPTYMKLAGSCCFMIAILVSFGRGPWWPPKKPQAAR